MKIRLLALAVCALTIISASAQGTYQLAVMKYNGGGDWYANPTAVPNLVKFCNEQLGMNINAEVPNVEVGSPDIFTYPWLDVTGHGNITFSPQEAENLRNYLLGGGFLHVSDNYGIDQFLRPAMKLVFPELEFVELPFGHSIYHQKFDFPKGLPKIHEHDGLPAQGFGLIWEGRLVCFYDYQCDLGDGWEDHDVHNDPPELHTAALRMGANMVQYVFGGVE
ncbi:MAG: DUF4159 domain-containing protein [Flavobacteriales bacterium]|nr:DUF4159 domain-containing protein [Flavobacteriales bacterium]